MVASFARESDGQGTADMDISTSGEIPLHEQGSDSESTHEPRRSNKRAKISASGSWREGDVHTDNDQQDAMDWTANSSTTSLCSEMMDGSHSSPDRSKQQDAPPYASLLSGAITRATTSTSTTSTSTSPSSKSQRKPKTEANPDDTASSSSFTIYEDPEDRDLQSFTLDLGMGHGLEFGLTYRHEHDLSSPSIPVPIPESWHSSPGDDKENADEAVHEHGTDVAHEVDGVDHDHVLWNGSDGDDEEASTIVVDDANERERHVLAHGDNQQQTGGLRRYYQHRTENETFVVPSRERNQGHDGQISPTLLGAPPRRFQGRGSRQV